MLNTFPHVSTFPLRFRILRGLLLIAYDVFAIPLQAFPLDEEAHGIDGIGLASTTNRLCESADGAATVLLVLVVSEKGASSTCLPTAGCLHRKYGLDNAVLLDH